MVPGMYSDILSGILSDISSFLPDIHCDIHMRSGIFLGAHCYREMVVEVLRRPLGSGAGSWGPAVPIAIRSWRGGEEEEEKEKEKAAEEGAESYLKI